MEFLKEEEDLGERVAGSGGLLPDRRRSPSMVVKVTVAGPLEERGRQ